MDPVGLMTTAPVTKHRCALGLLHADWLRRSPQNDITTLVWSVK